MSQVQLERKVLSENDRLAAVLRERFHDSGTLCLNLISSPGSGKTSLLEKTLERIAGTLRAAVLTGDIQTENDADRIRPFCPLVRQIVTGGTCHLDARMIERHVADWNLEQIDILFIENVGNLVCPSSYDLGEDAKIVLLSVTEGEDKPLKYPSIFFRSELAIITKTDLLPHVPFRIQQTEENARRVHPEIELLRVSNTTGEGFGGWLEWLQQRRRKMNLRSAETVV